MNEDAGGNSNGETNLVTAGMSPSRQLTAEEEAVLLAEYGFEEPYDNDVQWAAPSHFKSKIGDGHIFLTGAATDDKDAGDSPVAADSFQQGGTTPSRRGRHLVHRDPLRIYLHKNFPSLMLLDKTTPASLMETVTDVLDTLESRSKVNGAHGEQVERHTPTPPLIGFSRSPTLERHAAILRSGKEWARRASLAVQGASIAAMASHLFVSDHQEAPVTCCGDGSSTKAAGAPACTEDIEYRELIESTQQLLSKATEALAARSSLACDSEAADMAHAVRELQERETLLTEDLLDEYYDRVGVLNDDEEEEEAMQLLCRAREGRARLCAALALRTDDSPVSDIRAEYAAVELVPSATDRDAAARPLFSLTPRLPCLYAFELELPILQPVAAESLSASHGNILLTQEKHPRILSATHVMPQVVGLPIDSPTEEEKSVSLPRLLMRNTEVLELIGNMELRDAQVQMAAVASREAYLRAYRTGSAARKGETQVRLQNDDRSAHGLAILPSFVQQLDVLLSPTREEQYFRQGTTQTPSLQPDTQVGLNDGTNAVQQQSGSSSGAATSVPLMNTSVEQIRWRAAVESFLVDREASEHHRMRIEDELVQREICAAADQLAGYAQQRSELEQSTLQSVERLHEAQNTAYAELLAAANKGRALAQQAQELRRLQETEKLTYTLIMEWEVQREQLMQDEALSIRSLRRDASEEAQRAQVSTQRRLDDEIAAAKNSMEELRTIFEQQRVRRGSITLQGEDDATVAENVVSLDEKTLRESRWYCWRVAPLLTERAAVLRCITKQQKSLESVRTLLVEAEGHYRAHVKASSTSLDSNETPEKVMVLPENPPLMTEGGLSRGHAAAGARVLGADTFVRLLWPSLRAVVRNPQRAPQYLSKLMLSLEDLQQVDWDQLRHMNLSAAGPHQEPAGAVSVARLVKELDVSGNPLQQFDVVEAVSTFSFLQSLSISHAQLHTLNSSGAMDTISNTHLRGAPKQHCTSSASATSSRSSHLRHVTAARNHALAAQVHLLFLDVSSNSLASLVPLSTIASSSLVCCTTTENELTDLDSLSGCVQLRELSAAHNRLTDMHAASTMPLLREVDVGNNKLVALTVGRKGGGDDATSNSLMLLSRLYASHNPLHALPSSQHAYLCLTQLFVNHAKLTSLSASSLGWFPMLTVLQAEGNEIADISGVQHCPRLQSLRLSRNRLASLSALESLRCCTRLQVLDLTGNPCLVADSNDEQLAASVTRVLYELVPSLEVLNNSPRAHAREQHQVPASPSTFALAPARKVEVGDSLDDGWHADATLAAIASSSSRYLSTTPQLYREVFSALCWDAQIQHLLEVKMLREAYAQRPLNRAKGWELSAVAAAAAAGGVKNDDQPLVNRGAAAFAHVHGVTAAQIHTRTAEHLRRVEHFRLDAATLSEWISLSNRLPSAKLPGSTGDDMLANTHVRNLSFEQQRQDYVGALARAYIAEWLHGRVLVRRARLELLCLRVAYRQSEARRQEAAAQRIQPVWRGAALRSRLRRFLHPEGAGSGAEVEAGDFPKVNVDDWLLENAAALAPVELLFHDVVESAPALIAVPFNVSTTAATPVLSAITDASPLPVATTFTPLPPTVGRSHQAEVSGRLAPRSTGDDPLSSDVAETSQPKGSGGALVEQWGPLVAAQIRKKQHKSNRLHQQHLRTEFLQDPLRVKREVREDRAQQRTK
ncbi:conserved hypothetical protein [Leishmania braziliensis MHOM/BR/75/M2904]|uniref:Leucine-rich repeat protein (LRRP) n=1 Tax=Leishmania braziliensis TaxID=5660 RepID=A4HIF9_LEIBR|nr:conserved hypothetical protein [Leishmania braziliensis MHOM/BR/75/M2904]CAJ2477301.1 unnamed protein product [Leishmania braziliensis]CAM40371.2 conserved hypothetical protein [Leishmania braziliensis MHOM/BR/75/M2904]